MSVRFLVGDCRERLKDLPDESVQCVVTSPSYFGLRDYQTATWDGGDPACDHKPSSTPEQRGIASSTLGGGKNHTGHKLEGFSGSCPRCGAVRVDRQIGLELTPEEYIQTMVSVFREVRRVLRDDGIVWLNIGDSYAGSGKGGNPPDSPHQKQSTNAGSITVLGRAFRPGSGRADGIVDERGQRNRNGVGPVRGVKQKDLIGIPWMLAFALRADGWHLRQDIVWSKPNPMPESVRDRCTKAHEFVFLLTKRDHYFYDADAIAEDVAPSQVGRVRSDVIGGSSWKERGQHSRGGTYKLASFNDNEQEPSVFFGEISEDETPRGRAAGNKSHKYVDEYEASDTEEHRTKAGLMKISDTAYAVRNKRSVWTISPLPFREAHFATMPPALAEVCIKAGTSEKGCCASCGSPWRRVTEKRATGKVRQRSTGGLGTEVRRETHGLDAVDGIFQEGVQYITVGWEPTCECVDAGEPVPCTVLDPFSGAGTTALVADRLKRNGIGIELNPAYAKMAVDRITGEAGMFADVTVDDHV